MRAEENANDLDTVSDAGGSTTGSESQDHKSETRSNASVDTEDFAWLPRRFESIHRYDDTSTMTPSLGDGSSVTESTGTITPTGSATPTMQPSEPYNLPILDHSHASEFNIGPSRTGKLPAQDVHTQNNNLVFITANTPDDFKSARVMTQVRKKAMASYLGSSPKPIPSDQIQEQTSNRLISDNLLTGGQPKRPEEVNVSPDDNHNRSESKITPQSSNQPSHRNSGIPTPKPVSPNTSQGPSQSGHSSTVKTTHDSEIRLRIDASAPLNLQLNDAMNDRSLQLNPIEGGMVEIIIGPRQKDRGEHMPNIRQSRMRENIIIDRNSSSRRANESRRRPLSRTYVPASTKYVSFLART